MSSDRSPPIILASGSAVRLRLLKEAGVPIVAQRADVAENVMKQGYRTAGRSVTDCALALATAKAKRVSADLPGHWVIGADQMLECDGIWFDKPRDVAGARLQLRQLRGKTHRLIAAVAVVRDGSPAWHSVDEPHLTMRDFTDGFLDDYLGALDDRVTGSVGAYEFEGLGAQLFSAISGDYFSILGLPLLPLLAFLRSVGVLQS